jgi:hypothetical protein
VRFRDTEASVRMNRMRGQSSPKLKPLFLPKRPDFLPCHTSRNVRSGAALAQPRRLGGVGLAAGA